MSIRPQFYIWWLRMVWFEWALRHNFISADAYYKQMQKHFHSDGMITEWFLSKFHLPWWQIVNRKYYVLMKQWEANQREITL